MSKHLLNVALNGLLAFASISIFANVQAQDLKTTKTVSEAGQWTVMASPLTFHYSDINRDESEDKHANVWLIGAEKMLDERYFAGAAFFNNSFGQPSQYVYVGAKFRPEPSMPKLFTKISAGVIHGYKPPYEKKIPVNTSSGWGLGVIPSIGWDFNEQTAAQLNVLGSAGLMLQFNVTLK